MTPQRLAYAFFMVLSFAVFLAAYRQMPKPAGLFALPRWKRLVLTLAGFLGGSLAAKLPFTWADAGAWLADGKTITTGLVGAYLGVELAKLALGVHVKTGDAYALPLALALAVGRWGCYFNGCCAGVATSAPWGVDFGDGVRRHPTQVYESLFHLSMAVVLWEVLRRGRFRFQRLKLYLIAYGAYRFLTEFIRPEPAWWLGLTYYQWVALVLIAGLAVQWQFDRRLARGLPELNKGVGSKVHPPGMTTTGTPILFT
jgi:phosphatidylglycerol:prolipoprotein diacylglycerol transferase